jgi:hypothetical protein
VGAVAVDGDEGVVAVEGRESEREAALMSMGVVGVDF